MRRIDRFRRGGRGVFTCAVCGRRTRESGQGVEHLCSECFELSGLENSIQDRCQTVEEVAAYRDELIADAVKKGSSEEVLRKSFAILWEGK